MPNGVISLQENLNNDSPSVTWVEDALWLDRYTLAFGLIGGWRNIGGFMIWLAPARYINLPGLVCKGVDVSHNGSIDSTGNWDLARFTVSYGKPDSEEENNVDIGELALDVSAEMLSLPKGQGAFQWSSGPDSGKKLKETDITPQLTIPMMGIRLRRKLPFLTLSAISSLIGKINSSTLNVAGFGFSANYVLFTGAKISKKYTSDGNDLWEYDLEFVAKTFSWNKFFHKSGFQSITPKLYSTGNLNTFFT